MHTVVFRRLVPDEEDYTLHLIREWDQEHELVEEKHPLGSPWEASDGTRCTSHFAEEPDWVACEVAEDAGVGADVDCGSHYPPMLVMVENRIVDMRLVHDLHYRLFE